MLCRQAKKYFMAAILYGKGALMKVIAVDIDNVLNNFSATLDNAVFPYNDTYGLSREEFIEFLALIKSNQFAESKFLTSKFSDFRYRIHAQCYRLAKANPEAIGFMQWLKDNDWKIAICTKRNLRLCGDDTKQWLKTHNIPYDYLVMALNKVVFCKLWNVPYLVDDDVLNITYGAAYGITVFYPIMDKHCVLPGNAGQGFTKFEEIQEWIQELSC